MIRERIRLTLAIVPVAFGLTCSPYSLKSVFLFDSRPPEKVLSLFDCSIVSIPDPWKFEAEPSKAVLDTLNTVFLDEMKRRGHIEVVHERKIIGYGSDSLKGAPTPFTFRNDADSTATSLPDSLQKVIDGIVYTFCKVGYERMRGWISYSEFLTSFNDKATLHKLQAVKSAVKVDYIAVNSVYGTIRREKTPPGTRAGVGILTGAAALLSPVGGLLWIPGDETDFMSNSFVVDLSTGKVVWSRRVSEWMLYAVQSNVGPGWITKAYKDFDIKIKVLKR
jgi:hypothetical protein